MISSPRRPVQRVLGVWLNVGAVPWGAAKGLKQVMAKSKASKSETKSTKAEKGGGDAPKSGAAKAKHPEVDIIAAKVDDEWVAKNTESMKGEAPSLGVPFPVYMAESADCASFVTRLWEPEVDASGKVLRLGLKSAVIRSQPEKFGTHTAAEIIALRRRVDDAQTAYLMTTVAKKNAKAAMERAADLLDRWTATLEWYLDDGVVDDKDAKFNAVVSANENVDTIDGAARALKDYGALCELFAHDIDGVLGFERSSIDEGRKLSEELLQINREFEQNPETRRALALRNNLLALLEQRVSKVRKVAQLLYSKSHPEIARLVTSAYQRRARAEARRKEAAKEPAK